MRAGTDRMTASARACFLVAEGEIDEEREYWWLDTYVCVNEQAQGPPALGAEPPARFRQHGRSEAAL